MSVAYFGEWPKLEGQDSTAVSTRIAAKVQAQLGGRAPAGGLFHAEGPSESGGWWVFDIWASDVDRETFNTTILDPILAEAGVRAAHVRRLDVAWDSTQMMSAPACRLLAEAP